MVRGNNHTLLCKLRFYHCALWQRAYRLSMQLSLAEIWGGCGCSLPLRCLLLQDCFFHLPWIMCCDHIIILNYGKLWHQIRAIGALNQLSGTGREASVAFHSIPFSPTPCLTAPIFFLYLLWKGGRVFSFCMKIGDLNAFSHTCMVLPIGGTNTSCLAFSKSLCKHLTVTWATHIPFVAFSFH